MPLRPANRPKRIPPTELQRTRTEEPPGQAAGDHTPISPDGVSLPFDADELQSRLDQLAKETAAMKDQLRRLQKLASLGTTAAIIAHEFNNLFTPIMAYASTALHCDDHALMRKALDKTITNAQAMHEMADRVIGMARNTDAAAKPVVVRELVENAVACLCRDLAKDNIKVGIEVEPDITVHASENALTQVLFNLVINARQAMLGRPGRLTIDAIPKPDGRVHIHVRDTGCGIAPENLARVFEPFFSTKVDAKKPDQKGLGLGLYICRDLIEDLDGTLEVESTIGRGTTFTITLPASG